FAFRFLRLLPYLAVALVGVHWLSRGLDRLIVLAFDRTDHEIAAFWIMRGKQGAVLAILLVLAAIFDLARILTAFEDRRHMIGALLTASGFVGRHLLPILALYALLLALSLALFAPYLLAAHFLLPPASIVLLFAAQQLLMLLRHWLRVVGLASLMAHYRAVTGAVPPEGGGFPGEGAARGVAEAARALLVAVAPALGATGAAPSTHDPFLSPRIVSYAIEASLDPARGRVTGRERIVYRNATRVPMKDLSFHLYPN